MNNSKFDKRKFDMIKSAVNLGIPASRNADQIRSQVQLFLSNNYISHIPPELCRLNNLVVLSLS
jgi:Leucine-rich repeat (LRR) protein